MQPTAILPANPYQDDYTFIGWMNKDSSAFSDKAFSPPHRHLCQLETAAVQHYPQGWPEWNSLIKGQQRHFKLPVRKRQTTTRLHRVDEQDSSAFSAKHSHLDTVIYANWKQLQFNITLKDGLNGTRSSKGSSNEISKLPVRSHNDYTSSGG